MRRVWAIILVATSLASPSAASDPESLLARLQEPPSATGEPGGALLAQFCPYGVASYCVTPWGSCPLGEFLCVGEPCYCPTFNGPVWGTAN